MRLMVRVAQLAGLRMEESVTGLATITELSPEVRMVLLSGKG